MLSRVVGLFSIYKTDLFITQENVQRWLSLNAAMNSARHMSENGSNGYWFADHVLHLMSKTISIEGDCG